MRRQIARLVDRGGFVVVALAVLVTVLAVTALVFVRLPAPKASASRSSVAAGRGAAGPQLPPVDRAVLDSVTPAGPSGQPEH